MKDAKITPLTMQQYAEISGDIHNEIDRVEYAGMIVAQRAKHPEYGNIILVSSTDKGCLMIHFEQAREA
ncbi:MAG: hypothetical protein ACXV8O_15410 [Methylobacter sp.]